MGIVDAFKKMTGYEEEDEDYVDDTPSVQTTKSSYDDEYNMRSNNSNLKAGKVFNVPATTRLQLVIIKAEKFNDAAEIADLFKNKKAVIINLDKTNKEVANRLIDFLGGVAYAADGDLKRITETSYALVPYNVDISGDMMEELGNSFGEF